MTRDKLSQIFYINKELKMWEEELQALREKSLMKSKQITDMPFANTNETGNPVEQLVIQITDIEMIILGKKKELEIERTRLMQFIDNIDDSLMRMIVKYRCMDCLTWEGVASKVGGTNTADSVRKMYVRFCHAQDELKY